MKRQDRFIPKLLFDVQYTLLFHAFQFHFFGVRRSIFPDGGKNAILIGMDIYRALQKHLDVMPVAFPESPSGIEIDILRRFFSEEEALLAWG